MLAVVGIGAGVLQFLGPPASVPNPVSGQPLARPVPGSDAEPPQKLVQGALDQQSSSGNGRAAELQRPNRASPGPINDPDPALRELDPQMTQTYLPRIAQDGRTPMHEYSAGFDPSTRRTRVGILVTGLGMNEADSTAAIHLLPAAVTLAFSPYAMNTDRLFASARVAEHEYLLSIPMEPQGFPANDPDDRHALMTSLPPAENLVRLHWAMSRFAGYAGVTNALGQMRGERLSAMVDQFDPVLEDVAARGLLFVDARPGGPTLRLVWNRSVDLVIDNDPANEASVDGQLEALTKLAKDKGSALGLVTVPRPVALDRVAAWTNTLRDKGLVLTPVSALVMPPATQEQDK